MMDFLAGLVAGIGVCGVLVILLDLQPRRPQSGRGGFQWPEGVPYPPPPPPRKQQNDAHT